MISKRGRILGNNKKRLGKSLEKKVVEVAREEGLEASLQPLSGQLKEFPGDAVVEDILIECKVRSAQIDTNGAKIIRIDIDWLHKVLRESARTNKRDGIVVIKPKHSQILYVLCELRNYMKLLKQGEA